MAVYFNIISKQEAIFKIVDTSSYLLLLRACKKKHLLLRSFSYRDNCSG